MVQCFFVRIAQIKKAGITCDVEGFFPEFIIFTVHGDIIASHKTRVKGQGTRVKGHVSRGKGQAQDG